MKNVVFVVAGRICIHSIRMSVDLDQVMKPVDLDLHCIQMKVWDF